MKFSLSFAIVDLNSKPVAKLYLKDQNHNIDILKSDFNVLYIDSPWKVN